MMKQSGRERTPSDVFDDADVARLLARWPVGRLAMVAANDGAPWVTPVVFASARGAIWTPIDGKAKSGAPLQRLANADADPRASLLLDEYADDWSRLWWLRLDGTVRVHRADDATSPDDFMPDVAAALRAKYPQYRKVPLFSGVPTLLEFTIERTRGWRATPDAGEDVLRGDDDG